MVMIMVVILVIVVTTIGYDNGYYGLMVVLWFNGCNTTIETQ